MVATDHSNVPVTAETREEFRQMGSLAAHSMVCLRFADHLFDSADGKDKREETYGDVGKMRLIAV